MNKLYYMLIFIPISFLSKEVFHLSPILTFIFTALAIIPLAGLMGEATEELSVYLGSRLGGFLNATFGNATELILAIFSLKAGLLEVVKASIAGSIIGNILLVLGASMFIGGTKFKVQKFSKNSINFSLSMLTFAIIGVIIPAAFTNNITVDDVNPMKYENLSVLIAIIMLLIYISSLYFSFFTHKDIFGTEHEALTGKWSKKKSIIVLVVATIFVAFESEFLVSSIEPMTEQLHLSNLFVGLIILPIIGNAAEHSTAIVTALKNKMDISVEIAIGSSLQIILFVAPVLVLLSLVFTPMALIFNKYELISLVLAVIIANKVAYDGESNWLEGLQLMSVYLIVAVACFIVG
ncbi:calcium/proton exchanger [Clostridium sp. YIM B02505]|uniref:Ca(2+)/H(+) antiporter n=1 Tax=Clostridium yunnanense TaxID=2800325 RepID=A0ABS1EL17_9CLOT|nr:calcium/proton exchanger [Clostridium yunnanense]MBK1810066.1 calcium/proton exchanger [Clostridium yunnanense]